MPPEELAVYRTIQRAPGNLDSYEPWIKKMRPQDRLEIDMPYEPPLPALEWKHAAGDVWIGRLPAKVKSPNAER